MIVNGERARDGDYALSDLAGLRANPFHTMRDFEGHTYRDIFGTTVLNRHEGMRVSLTSTTGFLKWKTEDATDLDYTPLPLIRRNNNEESFQFTQEVRVASAPNASIRLSDAAMLKWQAGVFLFTQNYEQDAINTFSPFVLSPFIPFPVAQTSPHAELDDFGVGVYGQGTATVANRFDLTAGVRVDNEQKDAVLSTFFTPPLAPPTNVDAEESFSNVSPQFSAAVRLQPEKTVYVSVTRGYKAGGFNPVSPAGSEAYGEEHAWNFEGGVKTRWAAGRVLVNASVFRIDWEDLQLNLPDLSSPGQFYIANVGGATSSGVELELNARVHSSVDVFGGVGYTKATFSDGSVSSGVPVGGNTIPNTPEYSATLGAQISHPVRPGISVYGRGEAVFYGAFEYDDMNIARQDAYSLANFRAGARGRYLFAEAWIRNAFDTHYIPVAFAYGQLAPSGFIGEMGRPRTFGVSAGFLLKFQLPTANSRLPTPDSKWESWNAGSRDRVGRLGIARWSGWELESGSGVQHETICSSRPSSSSERSRSEVSRLRRLAAVARTRPHRDLEGDGPARAVAALGAVGRVVGGDARCWIRLDGRAGRSRLRAGHAQSPERGLEPQSRRRKAGVGPQPRSGGRQRSRSRPAQHADDRRRSSLRADRERRSRRACARRTARSSGSATSSRSSAAATSTGC